eukprot:TRINITY_DN41603_c0_g1_i1.p1 TRINITY_DN41603_c0_g1~~TRINITY_DN41603_c0_g1_i1.p1  ORF type:complete len:430 (-),score=57.08 TRINITY_DN41603_c0_g1_i1:222-1481(-)
MKSFAALTVAAAGAAVVAAAIPLSVLYTSAAVAIILTLLFLCSWMTLSTTAPNVFGGVGMGSILQSVPMLSMAQSMVQPPAVVQMLLIAAANICASCPYDFMHEDVHVHLEGDSVISKTNDTCALEWLARPELPDDAPIVIICPGLCNPKESLPGHSMYQALLTRPWRVVVFEKRGVGYGKGRLKAPVFHLFGHPSDLHKAVQHIVKRYPSAPLHFVSFSAGNGLLGSWMRMYGESMRSRVKSAICLMGGEDYNCALQLRQTNVLDGLVEKRLLQFTKSYFLQSNSEILKQHNADAYEEALAAESLQALYAPLMKNFSGYADPIESETKINGFADGNGWFLQNKIPCLTIYTADDPVGWQIHPEWLDIVKRSPFVSLALFQYGGHCACYHGWRLNRWIDELVVQWVDAVQNVDVTPAEH